MVQSVIDIQETVSQLIEYEKEKLLVSLTTQKEKYTTNKRALDEVDASLEALQTTMKTLTKASTFLSRTATSSDTDIVSATAATNASEILFDITVNSLAEAASVSSDAVIGLSQGTYATLTSTAELNTTGGQSAAPNEHFNTGDPNLDISVTAGTFTVNDVSITVQAGDTINLVLSKINASSAGVTAVYDAGTDTVIMTQKTEGSIPTIEVADGTSNFISAMKLNTASPVAGEDDDRYKNITDVAALAAMADGFFTINGITIEVDVDNDSVNDLINRINSSAAGVSVFYSEATDRITMMSDEEGKNITIGNDTSNFLDEMNILDTADDDDGNFANGESIFNYTQGSVTINGSTITIDSNTFTVNGTTFTVLDVGNASVNVSADTTAATDAIKNFVEQYNTTNALLEEKLGEDGDLEGYRTLRTVQRSLKQRMYSDISNTGAFSKLSEIGITFQRTHGEGLGTLQIDETELEEAFATSAESVFKLFAYDSDDDGLYDDGGFANTTYDYVRNYTRNVLGILDRRSDFIDDTIDRLDKRIEDEEKRLFDLEQKLTAQYEKLNYALSVLDSQLQKLNSYSVDMDLIRGKVS